MGHSSHQRHSTRLWRQLRVSPVHPSALGCVHWNCQCCSGNVTLMQPVQLTCSNSSYQHHVLPLAAVGPQYQASPGPHHNHCQLVTHVTLDMTLYPLICSCCCRLCCLFPALQKVQGGQVQEDDLQGWLWCLTRPQWCLLRRGCCCCCHHH
jgi:hypothetical protein